MAPPFVELSRYSTILLSLGIAFLGGLFALIGSFVEELSRGSIFLLFLIAPTVEELLKPSGLIFLLERRPGWVLSRGHAVGLALFGALVFAFFENLLYLHVYIKDVTLAISDLRWTVPTALHLCCSAIIGLGLGKDLKKIRAGEQKFELEHAVPYLIVGIGLHGIYNLMAYLAERFGWLT